EHRKEKTRHRIADDDDGTGPHIEAAAVLHRLANAERDGHEIGQQRRPQADRDRHRQFALDQADDAAILEEAVAEVEGQVVLHHQREALEWRLIKAVLLFQLLDEGGVETAGATIGAVAAAARGVLDFTVAAAADPRGRRNIAAL